MNSPNSFLLIKRYTGRTSNFENFASIESFVCRCCGEALFDQRLIPLDFARSFAAGRGQEITKVGH